MAHLRCVLLECRSSVEAELGPGTWGLALRDLGKNHKRNTSIHDGPGDSILDLGIDGGLHFRELTSSYAIPMLCPL